MHRVGALQSTCSSLGKENEKCFGNCFKYRDGAAQRGPKPLGPQKTYGNIQKPETAKLEKRKREGQGHLLQKTRKCAKKTKIFSTGSRRILAKTSGKKPAHELDVQLDDPHSALTKTTVPPISLGDTEVDAEELVVTPPAQLSASPEINIRTTPRVGVRSGCSFEASPSFGTSPIYGLGSASVRDRRKVRPRGVLTVAKSSPHSSFHRGHIPEPKTASVKWLLNELDNESESSFEFPLRGTDEL